MHNGVWKKQQSGVPTNELFGKTVGVVGMGHVGRLVASMLQPFQARIIYTDIIRQPEEVEKDLKLTYCDSFEILLPMVDDMLKWRKTACEQINAMFGTNISVDKNSSWKNKEEEAEAHIGTEEGNEVAGDTDGGDEN